MFTAFFSLLLGGCESKPDPAANQAVPLSSKSGVLSSVTSLASQINDPRNSVALSDPEKIKKHLEFIKSVFSSFPEVKKTVESLHGELLGNANGIRGNAASNSPLRSVTAPPLDLCEADGAPNPACPKACAYAAAAAAAWTCATAHAVAQAWAVAKAAAYAACPDGTFAWGEGYGYAWAIDEQFVTTCSQAFGYGYAWACTDGTSGAGAGAGAGGGIWSNFAGGALAQNPPSGGAPEPKPVCALVAE